MRLTPCWPYLQRRMARLTLVAGIALAVSASSALASPPPSAAPRFQIELLGFIDAEHTSSAGVQRSSVQGYGNDGIGATGFIGLSDRYSPTTQNGESGWVFNTALRSTTRLGLLDPTYFVGTGNDHRTIPWIINAAGQVVGTTSTDPTSSSGRDLGWFYNPASGTMTRIGYSTKTSPPGVVSDSMKFLMDDGFVAGLSNEGNTGAPYAWVFDPTSAVTRQIGLPESTVFGPGNAPIMQTVNGVSNGDLVAGTSFRIGDSGNPASGKAVWVYDPQTFVTKRIGYFDAAHTLSDGHQTSEFRGINAQGLIAGWSHFQGTSSQFGEAWLYDPSTGLTRSIGFGNPTTGNQWSDEILALTPQNRVYGTSSGNANIRPWVYDYATATTTAMGLTTGDYVLSNGGIQNSIVARTNSGFVLGHAKRGVGDTREPFNRTPWIFDPATGISRAAGLTAGGYTTPGNGRWATALQINEHGDAIGNSRLFGGSPDSFVRDSAWLYDATTGNTTEIAASVATAKQAIFMNSMLLNNQSQVVGIAQNTTGRGEFVWFYDKATNQVTSDFDIRNSSTVRTSSGADLFLWQLTDTGLVLGQDARFASGNNVGRALWLYDSRTHTTYDLTFSQKAGTGDSYTDAIHLADDGTIFGEYDAYSGSTLLGRRYFYWSIPMGFIDLQSLVANDLASNGWADLVHSSGFSLGLDYVRDGLLIGRGLRSNGNNLPFALVLVPEPTGALLFLAGGLVFGAFGRRTRRSSRWHGRHQ